MRRPILPWPGGFQHSGIHVPSSPDVAFEEVTFPQCYLSLSGTPQGDLWCSCQGPVAPLRLTSSGFVIEKIPWHSARTLCHATGTSFRPSNHDRPTVHFHTDAGSCL